jgi:hypothetical protein
MLTCSSPVHGPQRKRAWQAPVAETLAIRATATGWGFKWDSGFGGGKSSSVGPCPPGESPAAVPPRQCQPAAAGIAPWARWQAPAVSSLSVRATANSWSWTWDHSWGGMKSSSAEPLAPEHSAGMARLGAGAVPARQTVGLKAAQTPRPRWQSPAVDVLPLAATAGSWSWTWDHSWGGMKSSSAEPFAPEHSGDMAEGEGPAPAVQQRLSGTLGRIWQAPAVNVLPVAATAHTWGIKWDLYLGGGKMEGPALRPPPAPQAAAGPNTPAGRAPRASEHGGWEAPAVATVSLRSGGG